MNQSTFYKQLSDKLTELGVTEENRDKYIRQFMRYFNTMNEDEANEQIKSFDSVDGIANNIVQLISRKESKQVSAKNDVVSESVDDNSAFEDESDFSTTNSFDTVDDVYEEDDQPTREMPIVTDELLAGLSGDIPSLSANESDNCYPRSTEDAIFAEDDVLNEALIDGADVHVTHELEIPFDDEELPEDVFTADIDTIKEEIDLNSGDDYYIAPTEQFSAVNANNSVSSYEQAIDYYDDIAVNFNEIDDDYEEEYHIRTTPLYVAIIIASSPLLLPVFILILSLFAVGYISLVGAIIASVIALICIVLAGAGVSLVGIIYGILQLFKSEYIGQFEIGLGICAAGISMLVGILIYNFAIRFLPYVIRCLGVFFKFVFRKIKHLFRLLKMECAKQR